METADPQRTDKVRVSRVDRCCAVLLLARRELGITGLVLAVTAAAPLVLYSGYFAWSMWREPGLLHLGSLIYRWQTLIGALTTLQAASLGAIFISRQITASDRHEAERIRRRFNAARAGLPFALSHLNDYAQACCSTATEAIRQAGRGEAYWIFDVPTLPVEVVEQFMIMIEYGNEDISDALAGLLASWQVQSSRMKALTRPRRGSKVGRLKTDYYQAILDASLLTSKANLLYPFARGQGVIPEDSSVSADDVLNQAGLFCGNLDDYRGLAGFIRDRVVA